MDSPLQRYKGKLKEALTLVTDLSPEKKVEAVSFWNDLAEQLQEIVTENRTNYSHQTLDHSDIDDNSSNTVYESVACRNQSMNIDVATSREDTSAINNLKNALAASVDASAITEATNLKQVSPQHLSHFQQQDDSLHKSLSARSFVNHTTTSALTLASGKVNSVIMGGKVNPPIIESIPTTISRSYNIAALGDDDCSSRTTNIVTCSHLNSTGGVQTNNYTHGLLKQQPSLMSHALTTTKPIVSVNSSLNNELYCNPIDLVHSSNSHTIGYITNTDQTALASSSITGKHDHNSSLNEDSVYERMLIAGTLDCPRTRANYSDEVGNGQFDRGPTKIYEDLEGVNLFDQRTQIMNTIIEGQGSSSRSEIFTQSDKPLQQIQLFSSNSDYTHPSNPYPAASKTMKNIYYSTICGDEQTAITTIDNACHNGQLQSVTGDSSSSSPGESSGDSSSQQLAIKKEQLKDQSDNDRQAPSNQHTCDICGKSGFSTKGNLKRHLRAHSGEKPFKCEYCDSSFTEKKSLKIHVRRHTGEKPYKCEICGKLFSQTGVLQSHMALHLNERKFECQKCGKAFRQRSQLKLHLMRHDGVKRLECSTCMAKFLTKGDLERHCRIHTGERPYACKICSKTFTRQQSLNEHMNRHTGRKPYDCKYCDKTFSEMSACYKHAKTHAKQDQTQQQQSQQQQTRIHHRPATSAS